MEKTFNHTLVALELSDITKQKVGAIVNAANPSLMGGGGVDGAIHRAGGHGIMEECRRLITKLGRLEPGKAVITTAGNLPSEFVIHTVGPIWRGGERGEDRVLRSAYRESLKLADKMALTSVAFPSISTGVYGYPIEAAAPVALMAVKQHCLGETSLQKVVFALFSRPDLEVYTRVLQTL